MSTDFQRSFFFLRVAKIGFLHSTYLLLAQILRSKNLTKCSIHRYSELKLRHNQIGWWDAEDILLTKSFCVKIETDFERFFLILHVIFLFFPVSGSFFCRFARAPHHENSLNLRWDWRTVLCRGQFMHFQSTSNEWKKNPSVEVLSTNWFLPVPSIHLNFPITKQT